MTPLIPLIILAGQGPGQPKELDTCNRAYDLSYSYDQKVGKLSVWDTMLNHRFKTKTKSLESHLKFFKENQTFYRIQMNPLVIGKSLAHLPRKTVLFKVFRKNGEYLLCCFANGSTDGPFFYPD